MQQRTFVPSAEPVETLSESEVVGQLSGADQAISTSDGKQMTESERPIEVGGRDGPEPTRFGDWEKAGRCIDF